MLDNIGAPQLVAQPDDRLGMDLGDPGLGDVKNLAGFFHIELIEIVEGEDHFFLFRQLIDRRRHGLFQLIQVGHGQCVHVIFGNEFEKSALVIGVRISHFLETDKGDRGQFFDGIELIQIDPVRLGLFQDVILRDGGGTELARSTPVIPDGTQITMRGFDHLLPWTF